MLETLLATLLLAQNGVCSGADPAITSVVVAGMTPSGALNTYHLKGTVANLGKTRQPSNTLQFVDIYYDTNKVDARSIPPLGPGEQHTFTYDFQRASDARANSSHFRFVLDFKQATSPTAAQDCSAANDVFRLRF